MNEYAHRDVMPPASEVDSGSPPRTAPDPTGWSSSREPHGRCRVLHCPRPAELKWMRIPGQPNPLATWMVCGEHYVRLSAGERWAPRRGRFPTFGRWLLMGADLETRARPEC